MATPYRIQKPSIEMTFSLIRKRHPSLALRLRNALMSDSREMVHLPFTPHEIENIIETIGEMERAARVGTKADKGRHIILSALMADWLTCYNGLNF